MSLDSGTRVYGEPWCVWMTEQFLKVASLDTGKAGAEDSHNEGDWRKPCPASYILAASGMNHDLSACVQGGRLGHQAIPLV